MIHSTSKITISKITALSLLENLEYYDGTKYQLMAEYNRWMNEKIYTICLDIPDEKRKEDWDAFFKSIHGTLDPILWRNRALWGRLPQKPIEVTVIGQILYTDFDELWAEQQKLDDEKVGNISVIDRYQKLICHQFR